MHPPPFFASWRASQPLAIRRYSFYSPAYLRGGRMADITVTRNSELMVAQAQGENDDGIEFLDGYMPEGDYTVVDSGRIIIPEGSIDDLLNAANEKGLSVEQDEQ